MFFEQMAGLIRQCLLIAMAGFDDKVLSQAEKGFAAVLGQMDGVGNTNRLVAIHAPHPRNDVKHHAFLENSRVAVLETDDVALVPAGWKGNAYGIARKIGRASCREREWAEGGGNPETR